MFSCRFRLKIMNLAVEKETTKKSIIKAAKLGHAVELKELLKNGVNPNTRYKDTTALEKAAGEGHTECVKLLLKAKADVNLTSGDTPLMRAFVKRKQKCVDLILREENAIRNRTNKYGRTTLMCAAIGGFHAAALELLRKVTDIQGELSKCDVNRESVLSYAAMGGNRRFIRNVILPRYHFENEIMRAVAERDVKNLLEILNSTKNLRISINVSKKNELTPLSLSSVFDDVDCTNALLDHGANPEALDANGRQALFYAAACGSTRCLDRLIAAKSTVCWRDRKLQTALMMASRNGHHTCTAILTKALKLERNANRKKNDEDVLWETVSTEHGYCAIECLIQKFGDRLRIPTKTRDEPEDWTLPRTRSYDINIHDWTSMTALSYASLHNRIECARHLLEAGADPNLYVPEGMVPLIHAASAGHFQMVDELCKSGAAIDRFDKRKNTALFHAVKRNRPNVVAYLLARGSSLEWENDRQHTALDRVVSSGYPECFKSIMNFNSGFVFGHMMNNANNLLLLAAENGNTYIIRFIIRNGVRLNYWIGYNLAVKASQRGYLRTVQYLVEEKKVPVESDDQFNEIPLIIAACIGRAPAPLLRFLISYGAEIEMEDGLYHYTPLMIACSNGAYELIKVLIEYGAFTMKEDAYGQTALIHAVQGGNSKCVRLLLNEEVRRGMEQNDLICKNALHTALRHQYYKCARVLIEKTNFRWDWYNHSPNDRILLSSLLACSISPDIFMINKERISPLRLSLKKRDFTVIKFLLVNLYLTTDDYTVLPRDQYLRTQLMGEKLPSRARVLVDAIFNKPWSLSTLSFLTVSSALTAHCKTAPRREKVDTLPIPDHFKRKLAFTDQTARICFQQWDILVEEPWYPATERVVLVPTNRTQIWASNIEPCKVYQCVCNGECLRLISP